MEKVGAYLATPGALRPAPLDFGSPVFWGGRWLTSIDLIQEAQQRPPKPEQSVRLQEEEGAAETIN